MNKSENGKIIMLRGGFVVMNGVQYRPWWWSSGQRARLRFRQSEFESR